MLTPYDVAATLVTVAFPQRPDDDFPKRPTERLVEGGNDLAHRVPRRGSGALEGLARDDLALRQRDQLRIDSDAGRGRRIARAQAVGPVRQALRILGLKVAKFRLEHEIGAEYDGLADDTDEAAGIIEGVNDERLDRTRQRLYSSH